MNPSPTAVKNGHRSLSPSGKPPTRWLTALAILPVAAIAVLFLSLQPLWRAYVVEDLVARLDSRDPETCQEEAAALAVMGEDAIGPLAAWIVDSDAMRRWKAALVLSQILSDRTAESDRPWRKAVLAFSQILSERVSPLLDQALQDVDKYLGEGTPDGLPERRQPPSDPEIERLFREEALALVERKEWRAASGAFDRIIREDPEFTEAYFERARTLYHLGDHDACLRDCQETRRRDPSHTGALVFMGACYHLQGQTASVGYQRINYWRLAYDAFDRALAINPNLDVAHECTELYGRILWVVGASP